MRLLFLFYVFFFLVGYISFCDVIMPQITWAPSVTLLSSIKHTQLPYHKSGSYINSAHREPPDLSINYKIQLSIIPHTTDRLVSASHLISGQILCYGEVSRATWLSLIPLSETTMRKMRLKAWSRSSSTPCQSEFSQFLMVIITHCSSN